VEKELQASLDILEELGNCLSLGQTLVQLALLYREWSVLPKRMSVLTKPLISCKRWVHISIWRMPNPFNKSGL
jgi:hypothetical protein